MPVDDVLAKDDLVVFLSMRLDEEADLARHCDADGCGERPDPARVLREVEAKRRVLARHALSPASGDPELPWDNRDDCQWDGELWPCDDVLDLAAPYIDHPDFPQQYANQDS